MLNIKENIHERKKINTQLKIFAKKNQFHKLLEEYIIKIKYNF